MSAFTPAMRRSRAALKTLGQSRQNPPAKASRQNQSPSASPDHSAMKVAAATPSTPHPRPSTKIRSSPMLSPFISTWIPRTARVRSCAISQPVSP